MTTEELKAAVERLRKHAAAKTDGECPYRGADGLWDADAYRLDATAVIEAYLAEHPEPNPAHEELAAKYRAAGMRAEGTPFALLQCVNTIETYAPECLPADENGQIHFVRAVLETVSDEIRAHLAAEHSAEVDAAAPEILLVNDAATPPRVAATIVPPTQEGA